MKKVFVIALVTACYLYLGGSPESYVGESHGPDGDGKVVLYATAWCGWCQKTRELFEENNIQYIEYDIEKSEEGFRQYSDLGGGGIPLIRVSRTIIRGYNPDSILAAVRSK